MPPLDRITVARNGANSIRRTPWYAFCPDATEVRVLEHSLRRTLLDACNTPATIPNMAQRMQNAIDERAIREQLSWTIRYEDETLTNGYFFGIIRQGQGEYRFVAHALSQGFLLSVINRTRNNRTPRTIRNPVRAITSVPKWASVVTVARS